MATNKSESNYETIPVRAPEPPKLSQRLEVKTSSFEDGSTIPTDHIFTGCGGKNVSPQLSWSGFPSGTKSFAITCFDPDAPTGSGYWHWLAFDIPVSVTAIDAGAGTDGSPAGGKSGYNDFGMASYAGPCPPKGDGPHRYIFTVYALDTEKLGADDMTTGATVAFQMRGHVLVSGAIMGTFGH